jgi:hypothetical protein
VGKSEPCERCDYDDADPTAKVPDMFVNYYQAVCAHCAAELHRRENKLLDYD